MSVVVCKICIGLLPLYAAAAPVRLACASRSLGRLALVALTCLPAAASVSIYTILSRYTLAMLRALTLRRRPAVTLSPARTPLEQRPNQNQNQIYYLEQYTVLPIAIYSFVPPGCRRGRLAAALPRPRPPGRLAPKTVKVKVNAFTWVLISFSPHSY